MDDTPVDVIGIILAAIIMFIVPLILISERNDDLSQMIASSATADFVNNVVKTGKITTDNYQNLVLSLQSSGNSYDIDLEVKILDENASKVFQGFMDSFMEEAKKQGMELPTGMMKMMGSFTIERVSKLAGDRLPSEVVYKINQELQKCKKK